MKLTKKEQIDLIRKAYNALEVLNNIRTENLRDRLFTMNAEGERGHRRFVDSKYNLSIADAAKMFTVRDIAEYFHKGCNLTVKDYLGTKESCFYAASLVANYREEIAKALAGFDLDVLSSFDYVELIE